MAVSRQLLPTNMMRRDANQKNADVDKTAVQFRERFDGEGASVEARKGEATTLVNEYYDIVTDFYEYGWGQAFHFAPRFRGESFYESLARHEYFLALQGGFKAGDKLIDVGCGVGGPLRNIVRFTGAHVTGLNNNAYQISRSRKYDEKLGLAPLTDYCQGDFCDTKLPSGSMDGAYAIEATCHSADKVACFKEVFRQLKPGASFVGYEWIITKNFDAGNAEHKQIRHSIELGNALPTLETAQMVDDALRAAGFVVELSYDVIEQFDESKADIIPWFDALDGSWTSITGIRATPIGRLATRTMMVAMEKCRLAPAGSVKTADILEEAAVSLVAGGKKRIFTPCYFFKAVKPMQ